MKGVLMNNVLIIKIFRYIRRKIKPINNLYIKYQLKLHSIIPVSKMEDLLNSADKVIINNCCEDLNVGLIKSDENIDYIGYIDRRSNWPKYERFLKNNRIRYSFFNPHKSNWQNEASKYNLIIWESNCAPHMLAEARSKIYFLEKFMNVKCFPNYHELWSYEDKINASYIFKHFNLPAISTFVSFSHDEARSYIRSAIYPIVSKISTGSASVGVIKLKNKNKATKYVDKCFSDRGKKTCWPYLRQKNYVYFQEFVNDAKYDLRIIMVDNMIFGYYRYPKIGDFRASGSGITEKKELPEEAMKLAVITKEKMNITNLATDLLYSQSKQRYFIIETSIFIGIDTCEQLVINGVSGYYEYNDNKFTFKEGKFWIQELALRSYLSSLIKMI
jgi:glutathione synthase/RimK-type ligase-like ATP-grasp enzyme